MLERLDKIEGEAVRELRVVADEAGLQAWKVRHLGRSAALASILDGLRQLPKEARPAVGRRANEVKAELERAYESRLATLQSETLDRSLREEGLDVTLPGRPIARGRLHPATQMLRRVIAIWAEMGFQVYRSREVETDEYNFGLLNMPEHHPARDMWSTYHTQHPGICPRPRGKRGSGSPRRYTRWKPRPLPW